MTEIAGMRNYLKGLRLIWWSKSMDDLLLLAFFPFCGLLLPFIILFSFIQTAVYTVRFIKKRDTHEYFWEMIDRQGVYRCHLHDHVFSTERGCEGGKYHTLWGIA